MRFLIILDPSRLEPWSSLIRVVPELILLRRLEVRMIASQLVVSRYLIKRVLVSHEFILGEANIVTLGIELIGLFCREVLAPTSGVIPMVGLQEILVLLCHSWSVLKLIVVAHELSKVATLIAALELTNFEVSLSHLFFFLHNVENASGLGRIVVPVPLLRR